MQIEYKIRKFEHVLHLRERSTQNEKVDDDDDEKVDDDDDEKVEQKSSVLLLLSLSAAEVI